MSLVITRYDGVILVTRNSDEGDDVIRETEANCKEELGRLSDHVEQEAVNGGHAITIDEGELQYEFGTYPTLEEAEDAIAYRLGRGVARRMVRRSF